MSEDREMGKYESVKWKENGKLKLLIIVGTRPEIIRLAAVINKTRQYFDVILAHTGQNYDYNLNGVFFKDLGLEDPEVYLNAVGEDLGETCGNIIAQSYKLMNQIKPDAVLVLGDTNSCLSVIGATLGEIVDLLQQFKEQPATLMMPKMPEGSFAKKLYSLYLTYLPTDKFKYTLKMNVDDRGSFTELVHTEDCGQVSINISKPGITKGQHWHNSKWELFIVVAGHGLIQERNINTGETVEFEVTGDKIEAIHMIPGWTHNIINLSETENLVTVMTCNEIFNPNKPDTFFEPV